MSPEAQYNTGCPSPAWPSPGGALPADEQPSGGSGPVHVLSLDLGCPRQRCPSQGRAWLPAGCLQVLAGGVVGLQGCVFCLYWPRALQGHLPVHEALMDASWQPGGPRSEPHACSKPHDPGAALGQAPWSQKLGPRTWLSSGARAAPVGTEGGLELLRPFHRLRPAGPCLLGRATSSVNTRGWKAGSLAQRGSQRTCLNAHSSCVCVRACARDGVGAGIPSSSCVEELNSSCLSSCSWGDKPLVDLYVELAGFSG